MEIVTFNVGGTKFQARLATINNLKYHMLASLVSERFNVGTLEREYFIDREPTYFRFILNYLRDRKVSLPSSLPILYQLLVEAEYYQIQPLLVLIENTIVDLQEKNSNKILVITRKKGYLHFEGSNDVMKYMKQNFNIKILENTNDNRLNKWQLLSLSSRYSMTFELISSVISKLSAIGLFIIGTTINNEEETYYLENKTSL
jgi:hypothetical protein